MRLRPTYKTLQKEYNQALAAQNAEQWAEQLEQAKQVVANLLDDPTVQTSADAVNKLNEVKSFLESL